MNHKINKHTPGPWIVEQLDPLVCTYSLRLSKMGIDSIDGKESDANARLIAAAPDLLEQLEIAVRVLEQEGYTPSMNMVAAIAKARGEA